MLVNTRVITMIVKAFLFRPFRLSWPLLPSPGPGCFSTQRTWTLQYNMSTRKNRDMETSRYNTCMTESVKVGMMQYSSISSQATIQQANLYRRGLNLWGEKISFV